MNINNESNYIYMKMKIPTPYKKTQSNIFITRKYQKTQKKVIFFYQKTKSTTQKYDEFTLYSIISTIETVETIC